MPDPIDAPAAPSAPTVPAALPVPDPAHDPLAVLVSTRQVLARARSVTIDAARVGQVAADLATAWTGPPAWEASLHHVDPDAPWKTATWTLVLDALNFCFWSDDPAPERRWAVRWRGERYEGYWALAASLSRAVEEGVPLFDHEWLATVSDERAASIFRPDDQRPGTGTIPLLDHRAAHLREVGLGLGRWVGDTPSIPPVVSLIAAAHRSAPALARLVIETFPSFRDETTYAGQPVYLYKRAQIFAADLAGALGGTGLGQFFDLEDLTVFADYKVPQVLRRFGILRYDEALATRIARHEHLAPGSPAEVEIRAATVWGCELLRRAMAGLGISLHAYELDWTLWVAGQYLPPATEPYHRTRTIFY